MVLCPALVLLLWLLNHGMDCTCALQEEQRAERQAAKAAAANLSVREKTTFASRQQALFADDTIRTAFHETLKASKKVSSWFGFDKHWGSGFGKSWCNCS